MIFKKSLNPFAIGIILFSFLALFFVFFENNNSIVSKSDYESLEVVNKSDKLFFLEDKTLGSQTTISQNYKDITIGKIRENDVIYSTNFFRLNSNPFGSNEIKLSFDIFDAKDTEELLVYFNTNYIKGDSQIVNFDLNGLKQVKTLLSNENSPLSIRFDQKLKTLQNVDMIINLENIAFYDFFNWNKADVKEFSIVQSKVSNDSVNMNFNFEVKLEDLKSSYITIYVSCLDDDRDEISFYVNENFISKAFPTCQKDSEEFKINVPINLFEDKQNTLILKTEALYKISFSIQNEYFERRNSYTFNLDSFKNLYDVVLYGDFNKDKLNIKINSKTVELDLDEVKSIMPYLNFGVNKITFLDDDLEIYELSIEKVKTIRR